MIERLDGVTLQLAAREGSATAAIAKKVNELVDELNMLDSEDDKKVDGAETPPEKEDVTPEPSQQVQDVTQGDSLCNPKKEETPILSRNIQVHGIEGKNYVLMGDVIKIRSDAEALAVEEYKKRILDTLWESHKRENYNLYSQQIFAAGIARAIKLVEETE